MMNTRGWGGFVGGVLGEMRETATIQPEIDFHRHLTRAFAQYMGARSAGFQMTRFILRSGYDQTVAFAMAESIWQSLDEKTKTRLRTDERFTHCTGWWRV